MLFQSATNRWKYVKGNARCSSSVNRTRRVEFVTCARYRKAMSHDIKLCDGVLSHTVLLHLKQSLPVWLLVQLTAT